MMVPRHKIYPMFYKTFIRNNYKHMMKMVDRRDESSRIHSPLKQLSTNDQPCFFADLIHLVLASYFEANYRIPRRFFHKHFHMSPRIKKSLCNYNHDSKHFPTCLLNIKSMFSKCQLTSVYIKVLNTHKLILHFCCAQC